MKKKAERDTADDLSRDLEASLARDPSKTTRAAKLRELVERPCRPLHPLDVFLRERGLSQADFAAASGWKSSVVTKILREHHRPKDADVVAEALGFDVDEIFPLTPPERS